MQEYYVKTGDTMWKIANRLGIPLSTLIAANPHIADPNVLNVGAILYLPTGAQTGTAMGGPFAGGYSGATWPYTVKKGDSMWKIAKNHGVSFADLLAANSHIADPNTIMPGMVINVPGYGATPKPYQPPSMSYQAPVPPAYPQPPVQPLQVNIAPETQINADLNINQIQAPPPAPPSMTPPHYGSKPVPMHAGKPLPPKHVPPHHTQHPSVAKLYIQEEVTEIVKKKKPPGYHTFCYDPTLPPGVIIQGPPLGDLTNPFVPPTHISGYKPFYEYGSESASGWKMESKWYKESSS